MTEREWRSSEPVRTSFGSLVAMPLTTIRPNGASAL